MKGKIYTIDDVNRMLPLVARIADDIVSTYGEVHEALQSFEAIKDALPEDPEIAEAAALRRADEDVARLLDRFQGLIEEIEALGGTVKDYEKGSVDFYGEVDGEIVYLCWTRGETEIRYWHGLDEGFSTRRPISDPVAAAE